jgi:hypothetical protein
MKSAMRLCKALAAPRQKTYFTRRACGVATLASPEAKYCEEVPSAVCGADRRTG